jgi:hypothetical protein
MSPIVSSYSPSAEVAFDAEAAARAKRHPFDVMLLPARAGFALGGNEITMLATSPYVVVSRAPSGCRSPRARRRAARTH